MYRAAIVMKNLRESRKPEAGSGSTAEAIKRFLAGLPPLAGTGAAAGRRQLNPVRVVRVGRMCV